MLNEGKSRFDATIGSGKKVSGCENAALVHGRSQIMTLKSFALCSRETTSNVVIHELILVSPHLFENLAVSE